MSDILINLIVHMNDTNTHDKTHIGAQKTSEYTQGSCVVQQIQNSSVLGPRTAQEIIPVLHQLRILLEDLPSRIATLQSYFSQCSIEGLTALLGSFSLLTFLPLLPLLIINLSMGLSAVQSARSKPVGERIRIILVSHTQHVRGNCRLALATENRKHHWT
jgi:hypothetical protein